VVQQTSDDFLWDARLDGGGRESVPQRVQRTRHIVMIPRNDVIGLLGVVVGGLGHFLLDRFRHDRETKAQLQLDEKRKAYLKSMLVNPGPEGWRKMKTLSAVIGASRDETARLLIELNARASETGDDVWAFIKDKPLP
jgi:hypothetical protein